MAISALLITFDPGRQSPEQTLQALASFPQLSLGEPVGLRVPAALDTSSPRQDRAAIESISDVPGVAKVDIISIFLDDDGDAPRRHP